MKICFLEDTYIRTAPDTGPETAVGIALQGAVIEVEPLPATGEEIAGNPYWYYDKNGWYYWSGRALVVEVGPPPQPDVEAPEHVPPDEITLLEDNHTSIPPAFSPAPDDRAKPQIAPPPAPDVQKLNWAIRKYHIHSDWWQQRGLTGKNIRLALLSTGVAPDHPDLGSIIDWFQYADTGQPMQDAHGLGTQAAVICAGMGRIAGGIAPDVQLLIARIGTHDHTILPEGLIAGLEWAIAAKADIIAILVDFPELNATQTGKMKALVQQALGRDILLVAPVGNSESRKPETRYPAGLEGVFSVGAHDQFAERCSFSARSYQLDVLAPGQGLLCSGPNAQPVENTRSVAIAAAFAAGFCALVCQCLRDKGQKAGPAEVFSLLRETAAARRNFNPGEDVEFGFGLLDPFAVLKRLDSSYAGPGK